MLTIQAFHYKVNSCTFALQLEEPWLNSGNNGAILGKGLLLQNVHVYSFIFHHTIPP